MAENNFIDSKFRQVILAAKRARQLLSGSKKKIDMNAENPLTIAMEEIKQGKIDFEILLHEDMKGIDGEMGLNEDELLSDNESNAESDYASDSEADKPEEDDSDSKKVSSAADSD